MYIQQAHDADDAAHGEIPEQQAESGQQTGFWNKN
jgi:hypothetical protein